jgi:hypothetical protein
MSDKAAKLRGRRGAVLLATGALLGAFVVGPGGTIAQRVIKGGSGGKLTTTTGDKRYVKRGETLAAGATVEAKIDKFTQTSFSTLASTTLKTPSQGFLQIVGSVSAQDDAATAGDGKLQYRLKVGSTALSNTPESFQLDLPSGPTRGDRQNGTVNGFVAVQKGTQTITLEGQEKGTGSTIFGRSLSVMFVPKGKFLKGKKKGKKPAKKPTGTGERPPG